METFDTNVVLRMVYRDDAEQAERAARAWRTATSSGGILLTTTVLVELAWVLRVAAKLRREAIASALKSLCDSEGVMVESETRVRRALDSFARGPADFSDYLVLETARDENALPVITFDEQFAASSDVELAATARP
jgi:predicted nucleic-acid-binding protein